MINKIEEKIIYGIIIDYSFIQNMEKMFNKIVNKVLYKDFIYLYLKQLLIQNNLKIILHVSLL